jgi:hypothetical protein
MADNNNGGMPPVLRAFLEQLHTSDQTQIWQYLDGDPDASRDMIDVLCNNGIRRNVE